MLSVAVVPRFGLGNRGGDVLFRVLGSLEVEDGEGLAIAVGGPRVRALLATLLARPGTVLSVDAVAEAVWGDSPPSDRVNSVHVLVGRLRRGLGPAGARVVARPPGYVLDMTGARLDAQVFEETCQAARTAAREDWAVAARLYEQALSWWRGPAFAEFNDSVTTMVATHLDRLRVVASEERAEALLRSGCVEEASAAAAALIATDPLAGAPVAVMMHALAAAGRIPQALQIYRRHAVALREELGLDPSTTLRQLHARILCEEESLAVPGRRDHLPAVASALIGREDELAMLAAAVRQGQLVSLVGPGGVGKTRIALELATQWISRSRMVWWVDLVPIHPSRVIDTVAAATAVELPPGMDPKRGLCLALAPARGLLVLDNTEHVLEPVAGLIERLIRAAPGLAVLVTSRERLALDNEQVHALPPFPLPVGADPANPAVRLFLERAPGLQLGEDDEELVSEVCRRLDGLPLAIELGAARASALGLNDLRERLDARLDLLGGGRRTADRRHRTLRAVLAWSHELLTDQERILFRRLGVFPGLFTLGQAESICADTTLPAWHVPGLLAHLVEQSLVLAGNRGHFRLLETLRAYAVEQLDLAGEQNTLSAVHARDTAERLAAAGPRLWTEAEAEAVQELTALTPDLHAAWRYAAVHDQPLAARLTARVWYFAYYRQRLGLLAWGLSATTWTCDEPVCFPPLAGHGVQAARGPLWGCW